MAIRFWSKGIARGDEVGSSLKAVYLREHVRVANSKVSETSTPLIGPGEEFVKVEASRINPSEGE
jgi:hypothetical protein